MRYEMMLPHQIRGAIEGRWPVVLPLGVLEYHGEHMAVGMDTLAVTGVLDILEKEMDLVILPPFYYGAASYAVEPPEEKGTLHVDAEALLPFAKAMFHGLLRIGFRNIHVVIHHQTENFAVGMPTDLGFKFAARQAIFAFLEKERGEGWWGNEKMADYYALQSAGDDPFNWIKAHPLLTPEAIKQYTFDHAGVGETSLMMALFPEAVDLSRGSDDQWYARSARGANVAFGDKGVELALSHLRRAIGNLPPQSAD
jgi:creatinine amidohydrolase/Fe(II)-dependent formamide hydrolase-like protein